MQLDEKQRREKIEKLDRYRKEQEDNDKIAIVDASISMSEEENHEEEKPIVNEKKTK